MNRKAISLIELFERFPNQEAARSYMEAIRWPNGPECPYCDGTERIGKRKGGYYRCGPCREDFTVRTGTVMERSHIPLHKWLYAMYMLVTSRKGVSSVELHTKLKITQKSAWFMLHRLREACRDKDSPLSGIVEIDETYVGGKQRNKHADKKVEGRGPVGKAPVLGMRQRGGKVIAMPIKMTDKGTIQDIIFKHVEEDTTIYTDEHQSYGGLDLEGYEHDTVNHSEGEYVDGPVHTNSIEAVWAVFKRGLKGIYHHVSVKHLARYVDEYAFRLNEGSVDNHTMDRIAAMLLGAEGKRLTFEDLTADPGRQGGSDVF